MMENYNSNGRITFCATQNDIKYYTQTKEEVLKQFNGEDFLKQFIHPIYDLFDGKEFYESVDNGSIINYDGSLAHIFVDGYISNLGLAHEGLQQGKFLVDGETFLDICENHKVEVNWANK